jgi:H+-transporting ATPase
VAEKAQQLQAEELKEMNTNEILQKMNTSLQGLKQNDVEGRLTEFGLNTLEEKKTNPLLKFLSYFWGPIPWMIEVAAILSAVIGHWLDFIIVVALLVINGLIGFSEEHKAADTLAELKNQLAPKARVLRDGTWQEIEASGLVPGDIIRMRPGDIVPADTILLDGDYLSIDQSALTGESLAVTKHSGESAFSGTIIKQGEMLAGVIATGKSTYFGRTAELVAGAGSESHFQKAVLQIGNFLIFTAVGLSLILVITEVIRGLPFLQLVQFILILVIASIPVAMPAVLSVTMALGALSLSRQKAIVTRLASIEEMAGIDILCSDKTGTLTQNILTHGEGVLFSTQNQLELYQAAALSSREENKDPIDLAMIKGFTELGGKLSGFEQLQFTPFDPVSKRTEAKIKLADGQTVLYTKGAPQVIIKLADLNGADANRANQIINDFASRGFRTLGVASAKDNNSWSFLGIIPLYDPPRTDSAETISEAKKHGINVKMITGDNVAIAKEISKQLGLKTNIQSAEALFKNGKAVENAGSQIEQADGYAEVFPEHKYGIVKALQDRGHIVGMTGDGVNDAPALKQADVGIAVSGATSAAQSAADLVLVEPGLSVIIGAVEESRRIFERMNSYTIYRIGMTIDIMIFVVLAMLSFDTYPLTAVMIVILALLDDIPIMTIAYDNTLVNPDPVRWKMKMILTVSTVLGILSVAETFILLLIGRNYHMAVPQLQTMVFLQLVVGGHLMLFLTRSRGFFWRKPFPSGLLLGAIIGTQILAVLLTGFGWLVPALSWSIILWVWVYNVVWMFILDYIKLFTYRFFKEDEQ